MITPEPTPISPRRMVIPAQAHAIWKSWDDQTIWYVLKVYQNPENEMKNAWARWYCAVQSPATFGRFEYGDVYVAEIVTCARKLSYNPLNQDDPEGDDDGTPA